jgi:hypothetical protein
VKASDGLPGGVKRHAILRHQPVNQLSVVTREKPRLGAAGLSPAAAQAGAATAHGSAYRPKAAAGKPPLEFSLLHPPRAADTDPGHLSVLEQSPDRAG